MRASIKSTIVLLASLLAPVAVRAACPPTWMGADVSWLPQTEAGGAVFRDAGKPDDAMAILRRRGVNMARLRIWHTPPDGWCNLTRTLAMARRAKDQGMGILLDFHYSDTWADPGKQPKPAAWAGLSGNALATAVREYTRDVVKALKDQGTPPVMVQIGNEITAGMIWPDGRINNSADPNFAQLATLLKAGVQGVRDVLPQSSDCQVMLHIDRGGDNAGSKAWFDSAVRYGVPFDVIGLSYYTWWHGRLMALRANVKDLANRYAKPVMVVETAYPWTLSWGDNTGNVVGPGATLEAGYPATPEGQRGMMQAITAAVTAVPAGRGLGVVYWEPLAIPAPSWGSPWENLALFNFSGEPLPALEIFGQADAIRALQAASGLAALPPDQASCPGPFDITRAVAALRG